MKRNNLPRFRNLPIYAKALFLAGILLFGWSVSGSAQSVTYDNGETQSLSVCQDAAATSINSILTASDLAGVSFTWNIITTPSHGTLNGFAATAPAGTGVSPTGTSYTPAAGYNGMDTFSVQVDDGAGSFDTVWVSVTVNPTPGPISGANSLCTGDTTTLMNTITPGNWSSSNTSVATIDPALGFVTAMSAGADTITYQLSTGCNVTTTITVNPLPNAITGGTTVCESATTTLSDDGGGTWSSADGTVAVNATTGDVSGITAGTATVTYTLPLTGCMTNTMITINASPSAISGGTNVCAGSVTTLSDGGSGNWGSGDTTVSVNATTGDVTGVSAGTATVTYTLPNTCATTTIVTVNPLPAAITGDTVLCQWLTVNFTDDTTGGLWSTSDAAVASIVSSGAVVPTGIGTATITYTLPTTCAATIQVTVNPLPAVITGQTNICMYDNTVYLSDATGGGSWGGPSILDPITIDNSTGQIATLSPGSVMVTYTLPTGCIATTTVTVLPAPAGQTVSAGGSYCINTGGLDVNIAGSDTGFTYQLLKSSLPVGSILAGNDTALDFGLQTAGRYQVLATDTVTGCTSVTSPIVIGTYSIPNAYSVSGGGNYCDGGMGVDVALNGTDTGIIYQLYDGGLVSGSTWAGNTLPIDFGNETKAGIYKVVATNRITGCKDTMTDSAIVIVNPLVDAGITIISNPTKHDTVCEGSSVTLTAVPTNAGPHPVFTWSVNGTIAYGNDSTTYTDPLLTDADVVVVTMISDANCIVAPGVATDEVTLNRVPVFIPVVSISGATMVAKGQLDTLTATVTSAGPNPTYQWLRNGKPVVGANGTTFAGIFSDKDSISCIVHGTGHCSDPYPSFNSVIIHVGATEVAEVAGAMNLAVVPNPSKGTFTISGATGTINDGEMSLEVTNMVGQVVYHNTVIATNGVMAQQVELDKSITPGMYLLNVRSGNEQKVFRIAVEK